MSQTQEKNDGKWMSYVSDLNLRKITNKQNVTITLVYHYFLVSLYELKNNT
jgi:hypothetical protein